MIKEKGEQQTLGDIIAQATTDGEEGSLYDNENNSGLTQVDELDAAAEKIWEIMQNPAFG